MSIVARFSHEPRAKNFAEDWNEISMKARYRYPAFFLLKFFKDKYDQKGDGPPAQLEPHDTRALLAYKVAGRPCPYSSQARRGGVGIKKDKEQKEKTDRNCGLPFLWHHRIKIQLNKNQHYLPQCVPLTFLTEKRHNAF